MQDAFNHGMSFTYELSTYIKLKFRSILEGTEDGVQFPQTWSLSLLQECNQLVDVMACAYQNRKSLSWSVSDYVNYLQEHCPKATGQNPILEAKLKELFPPLVEGPSVLEVNPFIVTDQDGNILIWYLPGALKPHRQKCLWKGLSGIESSFVMNEWSSSWRSSNVYYMKPNECHTRLPGTISLAPAWFQQAHKMSHPMEVSSVLRKEYGISWIKKNKSNSALIGAVLAVMNPNYFAAGMRAFQKISQDPSLVAKNETLQEILASWGTPFTSLSVISNRYERPLHRDNGAGYTALDILATVGKYINGYMSFPSIGIDVGYLSDTLVGIPGKVIPHAATSKGERACIAYYMRQNVIEALNGEVPGWTTILDVASV